MSDDFDDVVDLETLDVPVLDGPGLPSPYLDGGFDGVHDDEAAEAEGLGAGNVATTKETAEFLRGAPSLYAALCLRLQREARGIAALFPSALACQHATPDANRVSWKEVQRGHVGLFDDPSDGNPFGHIAFCAGRTRDGRKLWWTNDAVTRGSVDLVVDPSPTTSWFAAHWGDGLVFGANWINGVSFRVDAGGPHPGPDPGPDKDERNELVRKAVRSLRAAAARARKNGKPKRSAALEAEIRRLSRRFNLEV